MVMVRKFLLEIFGREDLDKFVRFQKIVIGEAESYPKQQDGVIYYVAGSESDVYTDQGDDFVRNFIIPLLKSINDGGPNRAIGSCFGHQAFLSAFGMAGYGGSGYHPRAGAFQFGAFPVKFEGDSNTSATNYLRGRDLVVPFTRSGYVVAPSHRYDSNIKGLAYEPRNTETPVVTSMFNGKVITTQPHPEISLTSSSDIKAVLRYLHRRYDQLVEVFNFSGSESVEQFLKTLKTNFQIEGRNKTGRKVPWIKEGGDFGYSLVVPALLEQAESLGKQLSLND
jgi:GMP synthase-like glutamine amidotransferase